MLNEMNNFVYENHLGMRFESLEYGVYLNHSDILDYSWNYDVINNRISRFYRSVTKRGLPLVVIGKTDAEAIEAKNRLLEIAEADIYAMLPGKIYAGEYYTSGFITASKKSKYLFNKRYCNLNLEFTSAEPWFKDHVYVFGKGSNTDSTDGYGVDYPFDYQFDYSASLKSRKVESGSISNSKFKLRIYGEATDPAINIGGHIYSVSGRIQAGESLLIDSISKTITLTTAAGTKINWFDKRNRESYIFEPVPAGIQNVSYNGSFGFDLTIIEERSEPKWT